MEYRILGKTGLKISRMGFGGIPIQRIDAEGTKALMHKMLAEGVNYIDTARAYTVSEEYLGYALEGIREHFVIATKSMARTREAMAKDIDISLKNLRTDYIDLYQIHNVAPAQVEQVCAPGGALEALMEAKAAGKIGHIGITAHSAETFKMALELDWVETIMFPYNIVETHAEELIRKCAEKNIGFICMKPLAGGAIEDATLALRWLCANPDVTVVIPGEKAAVLEIRSALGSNFCRRCNYCQPCAAGISIYSVFLFDGYLSRYGLEAWARDRYASLPVKASACIGCGACEARCPYNLPIRKMLKEAAARFGE